MSDAGWIGVDLDGTLAQYPVPITEVGEPIPAMIARVKAWLEQGIEVRIVTARVGQCGRSNSDGVVDDEAFATEQYRMIQEWCVKNIGQALEVTCSKDFMMLELWDDRARRVETNTGVEYNAIIDWEAMRVRS
jgi:hypothetical protein